MSDSEPRRIIQKPLTGLLPNRGQHPASTPIPPSLQAKMAAVSSFIIHSLLQLLTLNSSQIGLSLYP